LVAVAEFLAQAAAALASQNVSTALAACRRRIQNPDPWDFEKCLPGVDKQSIIRSLDSNPAIQAITQSQITNWAFSSSSHPVSSLFSLVV